MPLATGTARTATAHWHLALPRARATAQGAAQTIQSSSLWPARCHAPAMSSSNSSRRPELPEPDAEPDEELEAPDPDGEFPEPEVEDTDPDVEDPDPDALPEAEAPRVLSHA